MCLSPLTAFKILVSGGLCVKYGFIDLKCAAPGGKQENCEQMHVLNFFTVPLEKINIIFGRERNLLI